MASAFDASDAGNWDGDFTPPPPPPLAPVPLPHSAGPAPAGSAPDERGARKPEHRRRAAFVASLIATALVAGGLGAAIALVARSGGPAVKPGALKLPTTGDGAAAGTSGLDVQAIAATVEKATVDITAVGPEQGEDEGTGMVLTASGVVLTNNHVIEGSTQLSAQVDGTGPVYSATVVGTDASADVAVLRLHGGGPWQTVHIGNSASVSVGDAVVAVGNSLDLPGPETVTTGLISAAGRTITIGDPTIGTTETLPGLLQTSAAISSGNSGGPLVDSSGEVIGMTTAAATSTGPGQTASDVGFAIPIDRAISIEHQIMRGRPSAAVEIGSPPATGLDLVSVPCAEGFDGCLPLGFGEFGEAPLGNFGIYQPPVAQGAVVAAVEHRAPTPGPGLAVGDVITSFDGHAVDSPEQVSSLVSGLKVGQEVGLAWVNQNGSHGSGTLELVRGPNL
ncbi:MAG TPA: trypsin-like peptidase domain-containing protein [Acidimicrobiales bacterium]|nr:trypsin-like peptidase domain-containing protein [Acidimicrobiales bacterium]